MGFLAWWSEAQIKFRCENSMGGGGNSLSPSHPPDIPVLLGQLQKTWEQGEGEEGLGSKGRGERNWGARGGGRGTWEQGEGGEGELQ